MSLYDYKTPFGTRVMPPKPDKPKPMPATLAEMAADAKRCRARQKEAWGEGMAVTSQAMSRDGHRFWSEAELKALRDEILDALAESPATINELVPMMGRKVRSNRHRIRDALTELRSAGIVAKSQAYRDVVWSIA